MEMGFTPFPGISKIPTAAWPTTSFAIYFKFILQTDKIDSRYESQNLRTEFKNRITIKILLNEIFLFWIGRWSKFLTENDAIPYFFLSVKLVNF